ncbi:beta strand repeat-containing protein [Rhizobium herbae]|uniref:Uncharacterized protein n=1 Tax=Rhizobium herbae TaxID=508661 RepID=A0ABS4EJ70_9HYPH|nr:calcium-binding protein [Rhizobium herbae]MBP1857871.1 hypothetical protein [Rhizobium herbae]
MSLLVTNPDNETDGGSLELDGASFITSTDVGGITYVFVAGATDNGISVFSLGLDGSLNNVSNVTDSGALNLVGVSGLSTITSNGNTYLIAAGAGDNGLSVFRVGTGGALTSVDNVADDATLKLGGVARVTTATVGGNAYVFAAGTNDDGISVFRVAGDGKLTDVANLADTGVFELDGVKGLTTAVIGGNTFLFAAGGVDDGLSVFQVAANGSLTHTSSVTDDATLKLDGASDIATAVVGGVTYVFATGTIDNGISVFSVNSSGILTNVANVSDSASLRLAGATGLSVSLMGSTTYLTVGGGENGLSMFRVNAGGTLTFMDNIDDGGSRELAGTTQVHTATVGGTSYIIAAGSTDDGISTLGLKPSGQLWFTTEGGDGDTRIVRVNNDGSSQTINIDNTPATDPLPSSFQADVGLDTAAGFYFGLSNSGTFGDNALLVRGNIGSSATPTTVVDFPDTVIVNGMQVDAINHKIYVGYQDGSGSAPANTGIRVYSYNPLTGALTDQGFLVTSATDTRGQESGFDLLDPRDFALDSSIGRLFYTELLTGGAASIGLFRLDLASPNTTTQLVSQAQFPDDGSNGYIYDVEVDQTTDLVYFTTQSNAPSPDAGYNAAQNAIWYISENASSGTAVKVSLAGMPGGSTFYPGDMTFDQTKRQLYVESEEGNGGSADDVIYVFQLDGAGTTATLINSIYPSPTFVSNGANIQGMTFSQIAILNSLSGTAAQPAEQGGAGTVLLTGAPVITDFDGDHLAGATVQITGGTFSSNETSAADDHLVYGASSQISGLISGTNITISWNASTSTLSFSGYDTIANYQAALAAVRFYSTGDNPTNYGLNTDRTITWTVSDGTPDVPGGSQNSGTTVITIGAVNDAPVNGTVSSATGNEDASIAVTGLQIGDPDANPALDTVTVTLSVTKGVLTLLTNVSSGLTSGEVSGNGTATVTLTGTLNEINATLAATNGLLFTGNANVNGTDTLTVVTNDGGGTGSGGAQSDTDGYTITINALNDAHTGGAAISGTATEDQVLTAVSTLADVDGIGTLHYQWQHDVGGGYVNVGTDQSTYTLGDSDVGGVVRVVIYYTDAGGTVESATSSGTAAIANVNDDPTGGVSITGTTTENQILTANTAALADADGLGTLHYQWQRNSGSGFVNVGTDQTTYTLGDADVGAIIRVVTSYTDGRGSAEAVTSTATAAIAGVNDPHTGGASITGTATEDQVLTAVSTLADVDGLGTLHYQWQHDVGSGYVNVGTDQSTYTLGDSDVGGVVRVIISYTDGQGFAETATSAATAAVANIDDLAVAQDDAFSTNEATVIGAGLSVFNNNGDGADTDPDSALSVIEVNGLAANVGTAVTLASGALLTLNADGTFSYDPNGAFDDLPGASSGASNLTRDDSFTYTLAGGDVATVVVTVSGVDSDGDALRGIGGVNDILTGGIGSDKYFIGDAGDTIVETAGQGTADRVYAEVSFTLAADDDIEILSTITSTGTGAINLTGNTLSQTIYGNAGNNILHDGGTSGSPLFASSPDRLVGGDGNDTYLVYNTGDVVVENVNEGTDRVSAGVDYKLGSGVHVELLNTTSLAATYAIDLTGNSFAQTIRGNAGDNILNDGGAGAADTLIGGDGNDSYLIYNAGDTIVELTGEGNDRVSARVDFVLADDASIEYLNTTSLLATHAIDLTGNNLSQLVRGNAGTNTLDGGDGDDLLYGMGGQDSFRFSTTLSAGNIDRIGDFNVADDRIELDHTIFTGLSIGALSVSAFKDTAVAEKDANDRIIYNSDTGALLYDADGSGTAFGNVRFATLIGDPTLTAADFFVV